MPPTLANNGLGENASQNAFERIVMDAMIKRCTLREEILKLGRRTHIWSMECSMRSRMERCGKRRMIEALGQMDSKRDHDTAYLHAHILGDTPKVVEDGYGGYRARMESSESFSAKEQSKKNVRAPSPVTMGAQRAPGETHADKGIWSLNVTIRCSKSADI